MLTLLRFNRFEETRGSCGKCLRQVPVGRQGINHLPHLLLTLLTGLWVILWLWDARRTRRWQCLECGAAVHKIMSKAPQNESPQRR